MGFSKFGIDRKPKVGDSTSIFWWVRRILDYINIVSWEYYFAQFESWYKEKNFRKKGSFVEKNEQKHPSQILRAAYNQTTLSNPNKKIYPRVSKGKTRTQVHLSPKNQER